MTIKQLPPKLASNIAQSVYEMQYATSFKSDVELLDRHGSYFSGQFGGTEGDSLLVKPIEATSGLALPGFVPFSSKLGGQSGFAFKTEGRANSDWAGHLVIAFRGTVLTRDWMTNFNIGMTRSQSLGQVHAGFSKTLDSMIESILGKDGNGCNEYKAIHCVGHSLGGALATLMSERLLAKKKNVYCYTFGAPRTGNWVFAEWLDSKGGRARFKRVYHPGDPVPMIPTFPFFHAPRSSGIILPAPKGVLVSADHHSMTDRYIATIKNSSWDQLEVASTANAGQRMALDRLLAGEGELRHMLPGSAQLLSLIGRIIAGLLEAALSWGLSTIGAVGSTLLDIIAEILHMLYQGSKTLARHVVFLVRAIMKFLGRMVETVADLTTGFLRWLLEKMQSVVMAAYSVAINVLG